MTKILIVEDNELNRDMLGKRLLRKGYEIIFAENGLLGIESAKKERPDIILMDLSLPVLSGWDAAKKIRSSDEIADIPIIALTAHAMAGDREKALESGCDEYVTKPIEMDVLLEKMEFLLKNRPHA